jgi:hypothetical protein
MLFLLSLFLYLVIIDFHQEVNAGRHKVFSNHSRNGLLISSDVQLDDNKHCEVNTIYKEITVYSNTLIPENSFFFLVVRAASDGKHDKRVQSALVSPGLGPGQHEF